ncbi:Ger(x)C family spore germination protein [Paenibacillus sinopodophylli]|uniref:Ger(x)C family spore germination protein n=1 Tax=Paenibacillus sinopodophylli TaxID=1837342 RepID=UPI00110CD723|nr:Ger(x)C family spore germination protein [Paenibacillus sinopodophylli]
MRALKLLIAAMLVMVLSGCWDNIDINHRVLPVVMGVSKHDGNYLIYLQIPEQVQNSTQIKIVKGTGSTINHAVDLISANLEDRVDLLHIKVIVLDKKYAEEGLEDTISDFMRGRDVSPKTLVTICDEDMDAFFSSVRKKMGPKGTTLYDFFEKNAGWNPQIALTRVWEVYRSIHSYTRDVAIPIIRSGDTTVVQHVGSAVIKEGRMVSQISSEETLLFNAFQRESTQGKIEVMNHASVLVIGNSLAVHTRMDGGNPVLRSKLKLKVVIMETKDHPTSDMIMKELNESLTHQFNQMFAKLQESEADILGIGQYFRRQIPRSELKEWRTTFYPKLKLELQVQTIIENTGFLELK